MIGQEYCGVLCGFYIFWGEGVFFFFFFGRDKGVVLILNICQWLQTSKPRVPTYPMAEITLPQT